MWKQCPRTKGQDQRPGKNMSLTLTASVLPLLLLHVSCDACCIFCLIEILEQYRKIRKFMTNWKFELLFAHCLHLKWLNKMYKYPCALIRPLICSTVHVWSNILYFYLTAYIWRSRILDAGCSEYADVSMRSSLGNFNAMRMKCQRIILINY